MLKRQKAQLVHNGEVQAVQTEEVSADEMWSFVSKNIHQCSAQELDVGDCWIGLSLASSSGLILATRVGKHTDALIEQLAINTEGKTECKQFNTDEWGGKKRVLPSEVQHHIGKDRTQRLERTLGTVRQQTGRWHRRQNMRDCGRKDSPRNSRKFGKVWEQTRLTTRLVVSYFNWIWQHSRFKTTAAQRAGLTRRSWDWHDIATYPTII